MYISPWILLLGAIAVVWMTLGHTRALAPSPWPFILLTSLLWWGFLTPYGQRTAHIVWTWIVHGPQ